MLTGRITLMTSTLQAFAAPPANVLVEISQSSASKFQTSITYQDSMGLFTSQSDYKFDLWESFTNSLEQVKDELRTREVCLSDGYPFFIPSFAS